MPQVLTTNATIMCPHGGLGSTVPAIPKWQINGGTVAVEGDSGTLSCPFGLFPCTGYQLRSMGLNASEIDGRKVILVTDFNQSLTGLPLVMTEFHQTFDDSTPAADPDRPAGAAGERRNGRLVAAGRRTAAADFSIQHQHDAGAGRRDIQFDRRSSPPVDADADQHDAPIQSGFDQRRARRGRCARQTGNGDTPSLTVTVTLTPAFVAALTPGTHHLFLTAISRRGLSSYGEAKIEVTP